MSKGTALRNVRVADDLWREARGVSAGRGESLSTVIRDALKEYVSKHSTQDS